MTILVISGNWGCRMHGSRGCLTVCVETSLLVTTREVGANTPSRQRLEFSGHPSTQSTAQSEVPVVLRQNIQVWRWTDDLVVKDTGCPCKGPMFSF